MIGPVSGTGRAMMASLQQAMQKGMPPDQAIQYVKSMATQGVAPLADLYAMMNQFQRLKQQPAQAPQTPPTIRDQLNMAEQQQAMMQQGVASLPAPVMEQAQFAGGGIVAFEEGGEVNPISYMQRLIREALARGDTETAEEIRASLEDYTSFGRNVPRPNINLPTRSNLVDPREERFRQQQGTTPAAMAPSQTAPVRPRLGKEATGSAVMFPSDNMPPTSQTAPPAPSSTSVALPRRPAGLAAVARPAAPSTTQAAQKEPTREEMEDAEFRRRQEFRKREGIGGVREEIRSFLSEENNKLAEQFGRDKMLAFAEAGFKMAAAASRPGATFLGALSEGAISGTQALRGLNKEMDANRRGLRESMLKLREAEELEKMGDYDKAVAVAQSARAEIFERQKLDRQLAGDMERTRMQVGATIRAAEISAASRGQSGSQAGTLGADDLLRNQLAVLNDRAAAARKLMADYQNAKIMDMTTPEQDQAYKQAQREFAEVERMRSELTGLPYSGGPMASAGGAGVIDWNSLPK